MHICDLLIKLLNQYNFFLNYSEQKQGTDATYQNIFGTSFPPNLTIIPFVLFL